MWFRQEALGAGHPCIDGRRTSLPYKIAEGLNVLGAGQGRNQWLNLSPTLTKILQRRKKTTELIILPNGLHCLHCRDYVDYTTVLISIIEQISNRQLLRVQGSMLQQYELALKVHWMARELLVFSACCKVEKAVL